jgi:hypothetical protein
MKWMWCFPLSIILMTVGCQTASIRRYEMVADSFLMLAREDVDEGKSIWSQGSGFVAVGEDGRHFVYTAKHVVIDRDGKLPCKLFATGMDGKSQELDISSLEVPKSNHDVARIALNEWENALQLSDRKPRIDERLYFYGDAFGAGVMNVESGKVLAIGPLEFEHTADIVRGMSGGPVIDVSGLVVGVCQKGRKTTAKLNGETLPDDSKYLNVRKFGAVLHGIEWEKY